MGKQQVVPRASELLTLRYTPRACLRVMSKEGLTSSRSELAPAFGQLTIPDQFATLLYSAVRESSNNVMSEQAGRKAIILLTDGVREEPPTESITRSN